MKTPQRNFFFMAQCIIMILVVLFSKHWSNGDYSRLADNIFIIINAFCFIFSYLTRNTSKNIVLGVSMSNLIFIISSIERIEEPQHNIYRIALIGRFLIKHLSFDKIFSINFATLVLLILLLLWYTIDIFRERKKR